MYHGIIVDQEFIDPSFINSFKTFAQKQDGSWKLIGIEVRDEDLDQTIASIQSNINSNNPWYAHLYNDKELIVVFKDKVFNVTPHISSWEPIIKYGKKLNIPEKQLDFWPNRFQDEVHYF